MIDGISFYKCDKDAKFFANKSSRVFKKYHSHNVNVFEVSKNVWACREANKISNKYIKSEKGITVLFSGEVYENIGNVEDYISELYINNRLGEVSYINGSFSIIIFDELKDTTILLSDRLCTKPLYYWVSNDRYSVSSSLEALLADNRIPRKIDVGGIIELIANQRVSGDSSQYKCVKSLTGSEIVTITNDGVKSRYSRVLEWNNSKLTKYQLAEKLSTAFINSFQKRHSKDISAGLLLSGGLDSRIVLAAASKNNIELPSNTLCSYFNKEAEVAKQCAEVCNQKFSFLQVPNASLTKSFEDSVCASDGLYAAPINLFGSLRNIRKTHNVLFSGHGIDYTLRGMYLPKLQIRGRTSATNLPILMPLKTRNKSTAEIIQPIVEKNKSWREVVINRNIHKYERILVDSLSSTLDHLKFDNPYDAIDAFIISTQSKHYTNADFIAMSRFIRHRSIAFDPEVLEVYFSMTPYSRISGDVVRIALNMLSPNLSKIIHANTDVPVSFPYWLQSSIVIAKSIMHRTGLYKPNTIKGDKISTSGSWVNYRELMRSNDIVNNYLVNLEKNEHLLDLGIFSRKSMKKIVQQHISGERNHAKTLHSLISLSLWLNRYS